MARVVRTLFASLFSILIAVSPVLAQQVQNPAQNPDPSAAITPQKLTKEQKKKDGPGPQRVGRPVQAVARRRCGVHYFARGTHGILEKKQKI